MGCATGTVKYLVFIFNLIVVIVGLVLLIVGVVSFINAAKMSQEMSQEYLTVGPILMIILGAIIFFIAFLGCCGALRESTCLLLLYAIIMILLFTLQIGAGFFSLVSDEADEKLTLKESITKDLQEDFDDATVNSDDMEFFNLIQSSLECCGVNGTADWLQSKRIIPESCCKDLDDDETCTLQDAFEDGCAEKLAEYFMSNARLVGYVALGLCITELLAAIFGLCLYCSIRNERRRGHY